MVLAPVAVWPSPKLQLVESMVPVLVLSRVTTSLVVASHTVRPNALEQVALEVKLATGAGGPLTGTGLVSEAWLAQPPPPQLLPTVSLTL